MSWPGTRCQASPGLSWSSSRRRTSIGTTSPRYGLFSSRAELQAEAGTAGVPAPRAAEVPTSVWATGWRSWLLRPEMGLPIILLLLCIYLSVTSQYFLEYQNLLNSTQAVTVVGIAAAFA